MIAKCLRESGEPHYRIAGRDHWFHPHFNVSDEAALREGVGLILYEAYIEPQIEPVEVRAKLGETILDLGGNIGTRAMQFADAVGTSGHVYAFEPVMYLPLEKNARENGYADRVTVERLAVGDKAAPVVFRVHSNCIDSRIRPPSGADAETVAEVHAEVVTLDQWANDKGIEKVDLIKIDIEGAEEMALRGGERLIRRCRPRFTISSYHTDPEGDKQHPKLVSLLKSWDYYVEEREHHHIFAW